MALPQKALDLIKSFEGYLKPVNKGSDLVKPYLCPANVPTIGWGTTRYPDGTRVKMTDPIIDSRMAEHYLASELRQDEAAVQRLTPNVLWHELMYGAIVSFAYNCGSGAYGGSGLRRAILAQRWDDVPRELRKWRVGGGRVLPGLVRRREAEIALFQIGLAQMKSGKGAVVKSGTAPIAVPTKPQVIPPPATGGPSVFTRMLRWMFKR